MPPRLFTRDFILLTTAQFLQALGFSSMLLLPLYLDKLGASRAQIGLLHTAVPAISGLACRPLVAWGLDRWGRKRTLVVGTLFLVLGMLLLYPVRELGPLVWIARISFGIGAGTAFSGYFTMAADLIPPGRRTEGLALFGIFGLLPLALNPLVAEVGIETSELHVYFALLGGVIACSLFALWPIQERHLEEVRTTPRTSTSVWRALASPPLWPVWLATIVFSSLVAIFMAFATVAAGANGMTNPARLWLPYALGAIGVRLLGARIPDRIGPANLVAPALGLYALAFVAAAQGSFLLAGLVAGLGHGYCFPVLTSQVVTRARQEWRGSALTLFTGLWGVSELVVGPALGKVADRWGDSFMFSSTAVGAVLAVALWALTEHCLAPLRTAPDHV